MINIFKKNKISISEASEILSICENKSSLIQISRLKSLIKKNGIEEVDKIRNPGNNYSPFLLALSRYNVQAAIALYESGTELTSNKLGFSALFLSVQKDDWTEITRSALAAGANPNETYGRGIARNSVLGNAVAHNNFAAVSLLLERGAFASDECNQALKEWAITAHSCLIPGVFDRPSNYELSKRLKTKQDIFKILIKYGARIHDNTCFPGGEFGEYESPLQIAIRYKNKAEEEIILEYLKNEK